MKNITAFIQASYSKLAIALLFVFVVLLPIAVFPLGDNFLLDSKTTVFLSAGLLLSLLWIVVTFFKKSIELTFSAVVIPLLAFGALVLLSSLANGFVAPQLLGLGGVYLAGTAMAIFGPTLISAKNSKTFINILLIPAVVLSLTSIAELLNLGPSRLINLILNTQLPSSPLFSLSGSPFIAAQILAVTLIGIVALFLSARKKFSVFYFLAGALALGGIAINIYTLATQKSTSPFLPSFASSWAVMVQNLQTIKSTLIGSGPESYTSTYLRFKPVWVNVTPAWNIQFAQSFNFLMQLVVTLGFAGAIAWGAVIVQSIRMLMARKGESVPAAAVFLACVVLQLIFPFNIVLFGIQVAALIFWIAAEKNYLKDMQFHTFTVQVVKSGSQTQKLPKQNFVFVYGVTALTGLLLIWMGYWLARDTGGQLFAFRSVLAAAQNNAIESYQLQQKAIALSPYNEAYRRQYSLTNLGIALAISNSKEATKDDKDKVLQLVQQSIASAKAASVIDPTNSLNWLTLGRVYSNLIGSADGAPDWTVNAYSQAIAYAPTDPILHLELGGILYRTGNYAQATQVFEKTITLKPDWANAYYNLANSYRQQKQYQSAAAAYEKTLQLVTNNSEEYAKVKAEYDALVTEVNQAAGQQTQTTQQGKLPATTKKGSAASSDLLAPTAATSSTFPKATQETLKNVQPEVTPSPSPTEEPNPSQQPSP